MKGRDFILIVFIYILLCYKRHKRDFKRGGSYIDSPHWIKNKKATMNTINKTKNKCFQYPVTVPLNYEKIGKDPERTAKIIDNFI